MPKQLDLAAHLFLLMTTSFHRLQAGQTVSFEGRPCSVVRVSDCAAVIAVNKPAKEFTTLFGVRVHIQPKPALVRISANSEIPIL